MKTVTLPLDKLIAYAGNPRKNDHAVEAVASAIKRFGFRVPVLAKSDGSLIDGHLRVKAAKHLGMKEVPAVLCDDLSEADIKALRISINRMAELAEWDSELLGAELEGLQALGIGIEDVGFTKELLESLGLEGEVGQQENPYTNKIAAPTYEPTGQQPEVASIYEMKKCKSLLSEIEASSVSQQEKEFLKTAATRHIVFNYEQVAEYYAHASPEMQHLMEQSALVIIDFNKAISLGYVELCKTIEAQFAA
jgi:hypothetical protein